MSRYLDPKAEAIALAEQAAYTPGELNAYDEYWVQSVQRKRVCLTNIQMDW